LRVVLDVRVLDADDGEPVGRPLPRRRQAVVPPAGAPAAPAEPEPAPAPAAFLAQGDADLLLLLVALEQDGDRVPGPAVGEQLGELGGGVEDLAVHLEDQVADLDPGLLRPAAGGEAADQPEVLVPGRGEQAEA